MLSVHKNTVISNTRFFLFFAKHNFTNYTLFTNSNNLGFYTGRGQLYLTGYVYYVTWLGELEKFNLQVLKSPLKILQ